MHDPRLAQPASTRPILDRLSDVLYGIEITALKRIAGVPHSQYKTYLRLLAQYNKEIAANPDSAQLYERRGVTYFELKDYRRALYDFNTSLKLNPHLIDARFNRARVYVPMKQYDLAVKEFTWVIETARGILQADAYVNRSRCHLLQNDYQAAIEDCNKALEINPHSWMAYNYRGYALKMQGDPYAALRDFRQAWMISPGEKLLTDNIIRITSRP
jgi:tetratricopeptide (TPR) repeat protein